MKNFDLIFLKKLLEIYKGWKIWHKCIEKHSMKDDTAFVLMPSEDIRFNRYGILYLDNYLAENQMRSAVLVVTDKNKKMIKFSLSRKISGIQVVSEKQMKDLLMYYCACNPDRRFVVVDIDCFPVRKKLRNLIGVKGVTLEQLVAVGVYHLIPFDKVEV